MYLRAFVLSIQTYRHSIIAKGGSEQIAFFSVLFGMSIVAHEGNKEQDSIWIHLQRCINFTYLKLLGQVVCTVLQCN